MRVGRRLGRGGSGRLWARAICWEWRSCWRGWWRRCGDGSPRVRGRRTILHWWGLRWWRDLEVRDSLQKKEKILHRDHRDSEGTEKRIRLGRGVVKEHRQECLCYLGGGGGGLFQYAAVVGFVGGDYVVGAEFFLGVEAGGVAHFAAAVGAGENFDGVGGGGLYVARFDQEAIYAVLDYFGDAAYVGGDYRDFAGHGFQGGEAEGF